MGLGRWLIWLFVASDWCLLGWLRCVVLCGCLLCFVVWVIGNCVCLLVIDNCLLFIYVLVMMVCLCWLAVVGFVWVVVSFWWV